MGLLFATRQLFEKKKWEHGKVLIVFIKTITEKAYGSTERESVEQKNWAKGV